MLGDNSILVLIILIIAILILFLLISLIIARYGRKYHLPEEVTKGIKSDTPFPSITSSHNSRHHHHSRQTNVSKNSSTFDLINNEPSIPSDFVINDSTFIVRKEFIPKSVDELPIKKNQILSVKEIYEDGWCMAISVNTGEMGVVPFQCLYKYTDLLKKKRSYQKQKQMQQPKIPSVGSSSPVPPVPSIPPSLPTMPSSSYCKQYKTSPIFNNDYI